VCNVPAWEAVNTQCYVLEWLRRRGTASPIADPILGDASGRHPTEKTYCQSAHGSQRYPPGRRSFHYLCETFCTRTPHQQQRRLSFGGSIYCSHTILMVIITHLSTFESFFKNVLFSFWTPVLICCFFLSMCLMISTCCVFDFCCCCCFVTVDAINDTMAAFYNDTDLFSGELWPPLVFTPHSAPNSSFYPLTLTLLLPDDPTLFTLSWSSWWWDLAPPGVYPPTPNGYPLTPKSKKVIFSIPLSLLLYPIKTLLTPVHFLLWIA